MRYEPIKDKLSLIIGNSPLARRVLYTFLGLIFLREWHVKRTLRRILRFEKIDDVLDAGSGFGQYSYYVAKNLGVNVLGVDINKAEVERCNIFARNLGLTNLSFAVADLETLSLSKEFDLIMSVDVMEHIRDDVRVFKNFHGVLRTGGKVLISTPSNFGGSGVHDGEEHSFIEEHFREGYSAEEITVKLSEAGLRVKEIHYTYGNWGRKYWTVAIKLPVIMLNKSYAAFLILPFYYLLALPLSLLFMTIDYLAEPARGSGLLVVAEKP